VPERGAGEESGSASPSAPATATGRPWVAGALVGLLGAALLVVNLPGVEGTLAWKHPDTGAVELRLWTDPYVVGSLLVLGAAGWMLASVAARHRAAGVALGAALLLAASALSVVLEGAQPEDRQGAWPATLMLALATVVVVGVAERPPPQPSWSGSRRALALVATAVLLEIALFCVGTTSYNNARGWSVLLFPAVLGLLGWVAVAEARRPPRIALAVATATYAGLQVLWLPGALKLIEDGWISDEFTDEVWTLGIGLAVIALLVSAAVLLVHRRTGGPEVSGASAPPP
jgi:hypothetical protein